MVALETRKDALATVGRRRRLRAVRRRRYHGGATPRASVIVLLITQTLYTDIPTPRAACVAKFYVSYLVVARGFAC